VPDEDKDWLGIHATRLNAQLLRTIFRDVADPVVIDSHDNAKDLKYPVTIASGWRPGWSTDYIAAALAVEFGAKEFIVAGKPSHVYDKDPSVYKNAKPTSEISWKDYRKLIPKKWTPGFKSPVDPVAAKLADERGVAAIIINGKDLKNFGDLLNNRKFKGTIVD
jgi:uridylate kinase